ncbi:hypothetical protein SHKM778_28330 [Streptomyces sp. KM77-8]|uniref:Class I SAM-dependent methyltransferase n=1 Tax=Streptomyces haneummycinicus TaxID=3074435 RepID=A0AAT9HGA1_9ACTN
MADLVTGGMQPRHRRLVRLLLPLLAEHGLARQEGGDWSLTDAETRSGALLRDLVEDHPAYGARTLLLNRQLRHLPDVLRGRALPPAGDGAHEQLHETDPAHRFTHRAVQALLGDIVARWPADRPLRVLEFGATTTALTAAALPCFRPTAPTTPVRRPRPASSPAPNTGSPPTTSSTGASSTRTPT